MSAVPGLVFGQRGFVAPTEAAIFAGVFADINSAFGGGLNPALDTPQGQLATSLTAIIGESYNQFVALANQFDPAYAFGRYQDALARIYFLERLPSAPTVVQATCSGLSGVVIAEGAIAQAADGNLYISTADGTIGSGGTVVIPFACQIPGPVVCPAGTLNQIYQAIPGWDSVTNASDGVLGRDTETRQEFEDRRIESVAGNSIGSLPSVLGAVLAVADVLDAYVTENDTGSPLTVGGVVLVAHSLYVAVVGGDEDDVARAIWTKKAPGCAYNGNTTVVVEDTSGYSPPYPSYNVTFEIPDALPILFLVAIVDNPQVPSDAATQIQNAIISAFSGADGGARARIGSTIYASRFYAPVAALGAWVQIISILIGSPNTSAASFTASIAATTMTVTAVASGALAPGQTVIDTTGNLIVGTKIVSQSSGSTGSTGTYVVTNSQTVSSEAMKGVVAGSTSVVVQIDQVPTIAANDITVTIS